MWHDKDPSLFKSRKAQILQPFSDMSELFTSDGFFLPSNKKQSISLELAEMPASMSYTLLIIYMGFNCNKPYIKCRFVVLFPLPIFMYRVRK